MSSSSSQLVTYDLRRVNSIGEVDEVIEGLRANLVKALVLRNTYAPINRRLPPEIIGEIFLELVEHYYWLYADLQSGRIREVRLGDRIVGSLDPCAWIVVTHVCQCWRNLALNSPKLWALIPRKQVHLVRAFIARSGQTLLDIRGHRGDREAGEALKILLDESERWRSFELRAPFKWEQLRNASSLEVLHLDDLTSDTEIATLSFELPRLRSVCLGRSPFFLVTPIVERVTITKLTLRNVIPRQTPATWSHVLRSLPFLEELKLENAIESLPVHIAPPSQRVSLPRLHSLSLLEENGGVACATFLNMIPFPPSTRIMCHGDLLDSVDKSRHLLESIFTNLARCTSDSTQVPKFRACRIACPIEPDRFLSIDAWTYEISLEDMSPKSQQSIPAPSISLLWMGACASDCRATAHAFLDIFPLSHVQVFSVVGFLSCFVRTQDHVKLRNIHSLCVEYIVELEVNLARDVESLCPLDEGTPFPFPNLKHLTFQSAPWLDHPRGYSKHGVGNVVHDVRGMLLRRQAAGLPLKSLNLHVGFDVNDDEVAALMEDGLVEKVTVVKMEGV